MNTKQVNNPYMLKNNLQIKNNIKNNTAQTYYNLEVKGTGNEIKDSVTISKEGEEKSKKRKQELEEMDRKYQELMEQLRQSKEQSEEAGNALRTRAKCMLIAMRIIGGDEVPKADHRYLAKNDMELYSRAVIMRMKRDNPKKYKRVSEDEESNIKLGITNSTESEMKIEGGEIQAESGSTVDLASLMIE